MRFLQGLSGISGLAGLSEEAKKAIRNNSKAVEEVLKRANRLNGLGKTSNTIIKTDEFIVDKRYNPNISNDEIKAWVYYKRSLGVAMKGWERYYINGTGGDSTLLTTITDTKLRDEHFIGIGISPAGTTLGTLIEGRDYNSPTDNSAWLYFTDKAGRIRCVDGSAVRKTKSPFTADKKEIDRLVKCGCLFYNKGRFLPYPVYSYGNSYDRELQLRDDKEYIVKTYGQAVYDNHEKVIKENRPKQLSFLNPVSEDRPQISPISEYAHDFIIESLEGYEGSDIWGTYKNGEYVRTLYSAFEWWLNENRRNMEMFQKSVDAYDIVKYYLRGDNIPRKRLGEAQANQLEKETREEGERLFSVFIETAVTYRDKQKLDIDWNRKYNAYPNLRYDKIPVGFTANSKFKGGDFEIRPAQREGIAFMEMVNSGCVSFDVGVTTGRMLQIENQLIAIRRCCFL